MSFYKSYWFWVGLLLAMIADMTTITLNIGDRSYYIRPTPPACTVIYLIFYVIVRITS